MFDILPTRGVRALIIACAALAVATAVQAQRPADATPLKVSQAQFQGLKFVEGKWRGTGYRVPFFEWYRVVNDSTIELSTADDSTFATTQPGSSIVLRSGSIYSQSNGQSRWVVTRIDTAGYYFSAIGRPGGFVWKPVTPNQWTAVLQNGTNYQMYRIK